MRAATRPSGVKKARKTPDALARYRAKRDFEKTAEPRGRVERRGGGRYFVQKHDASRLHFDLRLEMAGVLKSWAVPKGMPMAAGERHLAVMVEDHPLDYGSFEGIIPAGEYGGGTVMLWDRGTYEVGGGNPEAALRQGKLHLFFTGEKLRSEWTLVRMKDSEDQWLLLKSGETVKPSRKWDRSVASARTLEEIAATLAMPGYVEPMKCKPATQLPAGEEWRYELKFDGYRFLGGKAGEETRLWSRTENDLTLRFPTVATALRELKAKSALVDGELVVTDEQGRPSFQLIQNADAKTPVRAFVFDVLEIDGASVRDETLDERRARLEKILPAGSHVLQLSRELSGDPEAVQKEICARGLEGVIAKRGGSRYEAGRRSGAWVKVRCFREQEFVIGGFTNPRGGRAHFGSILVGYFRGRRLVYAGKVGTGFDDALLRTLHRQMLWRRTAECPFTATPKRAGTMTDYLTRGELAQCTWVKPRLVAQVRFVEWTGDGLLRQPSFLGLRDDKSARQVVKET